MAFSKIIPSAGVLALYAMQFAPSVLADLETCPNDSPLSCSSSGTKASCCYNNPGGALLLTQFWDYDPTTGPGDSWTLHGLWPDNCDGTYEQFCDSSREYSNITDILQEQGRTDLLSYMNTYWKDYKGDDESFWEHEWNKHGTCINTIEPDCYTDYTSQEEVGDYFQAAVGLFKTLDTYKALAKAGITPSESATYDLSKIQSALADLNGGHAPYLGCDGSNLNQAWYFFNTKGNLVNGDFQPTDSLTDSDCPSSGIKYNPKSNSNLNSTVASWRRLQSKRAATRVAY